MTGKTFISTLFSSSEGNCVYIKNKGEEYLIDAGVSARTIECTLKELGTSLAGINAIFITHEHSDHIRGLETISKYYKIPVYAPAACCQAISQNYIHTALCLNPLELPVSVEFGETTVTPFSTPHDSVASCGYVVDFGDFKFGLATDMGYITKAAAKALTGCEAVVIESNHDIEMLKKGPYPYHLKKRILGNYGHLSNAACAEFLPYLVLNGTKCIALAHLSAENNTPEVAYTESGNLLKSKGISVCTPETPGDVNIAVAPRRGIYVLANK
jgi:phosphoribosyl 1,2-cyclic phosphodiesterase